MLRFRHFTVVFVLAALAGCDPSAPLDTSLARMSGPEIKPAEKPLSGTRTTTVSLNDVGADFTYSFAWDKTGDPPFTATDLDKAGRPITVYTQTKATVGVEQRTDAAAPFNISFSWPGVPDAARATVELLSIQGESVSVLGSVELAIADRFNPDDPPISGNGARSYHFRNGIRYVDYPLAEDPVGGDGVPFLVPGKDPIPGVTHTALTFEAGIDVPKTVAVRFEYPANATFRVTPSDPW